MKRKSGNSRVPAQQRSIARVKSILHASLTLFGQDGLSPIGMKDIARQASISQSSIYQYFPDKNAIIEALGEKLKSTLLKTVNDYPTPINNIDDVKPYAQYLTNAAAQMLANRPGWLIIINELITSNRYAENSFNYSVALSQRFSDRFQHLIPIDNQENLRATCLWWIHIAYTSILVSIQTDNDNRELNYACEVLEERISQLLTPAS